MNLVVLSGNLTADPEMRYTANGKAVASFRMAVNEGSGENRTTIYLNCQAWERLAETVTEWAKKGRKVLVTGSMLPDDWVDKNGNKHTGFKINCRNVEFLDRREDTAPVPAKAEDDDLDDLPF